MSRIYRSLPPKGTRLGIAFSGGLDTRCAVARLSRQGMNVHAYTAGVEPTGKSDTEAGAGRREGTVDAAHGAAGYHEGDRLARLA